MANLSITAANVGINDDAQIMLVQVGEAITQGMPMYRDGTDGKYKKCEAGSTVEKADMAGIAITPAALDGSVVMARGGLINIGATLTKGAVYAVSASAGAIAPIADLASTEWVTVLGVATSTDAIDLQINASGAQVA